MKLVFFKFTDEWNSQVYGFFLQMVLHDTVVIVVGVSNLFLNYKGRNT